MSNQPATPKPPRNSRNNPKRAVTTPTSSKTQQTKSASPGHSSPSPQRVTPPASRPPEGTSAYDSSNHFSEGTTGKGKGKEKKKQGKHTNLSPLPDNTNTAGHRHSASQPSLQSSPPFDDSSRYAGPTFHASPAASALPLPTFFSKSVPDTEWSTDPGMTALETEDESQDTEPGELTPSKSRSALKEDVARKGHSSSPLDFLFKAARDSKGATQANLSDGNSERASPVPQTHKSLKSPQSASTDGAMFSFEMETPEPKSTPIGPSFATPYRERMDALRSTSSPLQSPHTPPYDEGQRNGKPEIQKNFRLDPRLQQPASMSPQRLDEPPNPHGQPKPSLEPPTNSFHTTSGHVAPISAASYDQRSRTSTKTPGAAYGKNGVPHQYNGSACNHSQSVRTPSSNLCKEMSPPSPTLSPSRPQRERHVDSAIPHPQTSARVGNPVSSPMRSGPYPPVAPPGPYGVPDQAQPTDTKQMEDYLRRALKLDANGR